MRIWLVERLGELGLPGWIAPSYAMLVGIAGLLGAFIVLHATRRGGGNVPATARALLLAYVAALLGGYVYEWIRVTPEALTTWSVEPYLHVGRAAYGGLLFAVAAGAWHLRRREEPLAPFFDRVALAIGVVWALVRAGCLLEGCDYGRVTASALGLRYPPGSLAALDHARHGWVPAGHASLPTHPTQLYEGAVALAGSALAALLYVHARRTGRAYGAAFPAWLAVYAAGRFAVELVRADPDRGLYAGLSTAQWTSVCVFGVAAILLARHSLGASRPASAPVAPMER